MYVDYGTSIENVSIEIPTGYIKYFDYKHYTFDELLEKIVELTDELNELEAKISEMEEK